MTSSNESNRHSSADSLNGLSEQQLKEEIVRLRQENKVLQRIVDSEEDALFDSITTDEQSEDVLTAEQEQTRQDLLAQFDKENGDHQTFISGPLTVERLGGTKVNVTCDVDGMVVYGSGDERKTHRFKAGETASLIIPKGYAPSYEDLWADIQFLPNRPIVENARDIGYEAVHGNESRKSFTINFILRPADRDPAMDDPRY